MTRLYQFSIGDLWKWDTQILKHVCARRNQHRHQCSATSSISTARCYPNGVRGVTSCSNGMNWRGLPLTGMFYCAACLADQGIDLMSSLDESPTTADAGCEQTGGGTHVNLPLAGRGDYSQNAKHWRRRSG